MVSKIELVAYMPPTNLGQEIKYVDTRDYPFNNFPYEKEQKSLVWLQKNAWMKNINILKWISKKITFVKKKFLK